MAVSLVSARLDASGEGEGCDVTRAMPSLPCAVSPPLVSNAPQGVLRCWVDIMPPGEAKAFPPDDVALPPPIEFEVMEAEISCVRLQWPEDEEIWSKYTSK